jgi:hypothetical protein
LIALVSKPSAARRSVWWQAIWISITPVLQLASTRALASTSRSTAIRIVARGRVRNIRRITPGNVAWSEIRQPRGSVARTL